MVNVEKIGEYLKETGLADRFDNLKPGDSFGVEIPVDEENNKWLRFWLTAEGSGEKLEFVTLDFEGIIRIKVCCDEKKIENWLKSTGILELAEADDNIPIEKAE